MAGRVWTNKSVVALIRKLHAKGVDLCPSAIQRSHGALFSSARSHSHFGNWGEAIAAAGLDYETIRRVKKRWTREDILRQLRQHHSNGEDLFDPQFKQRHRGLYLAAVAQRYFGSWRRAVEAAGIDIELLKERRMWTRARIVRVIGELAAGGESLGWANVERLAPGIYRAARRKENFGSWREALIAAGIEPPPHTRGRRPRVATAGTAASDLAGELDRPVSPAAGGQPAMAMPECGLEEHERGVMLPRN